MFDPKNIHAFEQATGAMLQLAGLLAAYRRALLNEGFTREEALVLIEAYQYTLTTHHKNEDPE